MLNVKKMLTKMANQFANMECGRVTNLGEVSSNSTKDATITFSNTFSEAPKVVACIESSSTAYGMGRLTCAVHSVTTTGCKVRVFNADTSGRSPYIHWIAIAK